jgi:SM-20-related protein
VRAAVRGGIAGNMASCNGAGTDEASQIAAVVDRLGLDGYAVCTGLLPRPLVASLVAEQRRREDGGELVVAGVGRGTPVAHIGTSPALSPGAGLRHAQASWLADHVDQPAAEREFLAFAERLRLAINRRLMLGLFEFEAQFLFYPPGGFYGRHIDALHGERSRVVSLIAYLNVDWRPTDGGTLAVWAAGGAGEPVIEVVPEAGTVVLMLSEEIPHEARAASRDRRAIAGWFRLNPSSATRVDPVR